MRKLFGTAVAGAVLATILTAAPAIASPLGYTVLHCSRAYHDSSMGDVAGFDFEVGLLTRKPALQMIRHDAKALRANASEENSQQLYSDCGDLGGTSLSSRTRSQAAAVVYTLDSYGLHFMDSYGWHGIDRIGAAECGTAMALSPLSNADVRLLARAWSDWFTMRQGAIIAGALIGAYCPAAF